MPTMTRDELTQFAETRTSLIRELEAERDAARAERDELRERLKRTLSVNCSVKSDECAARGLCTNKCGAFDINQPG